MGNKTPALPPVVYAQWVVVLASQFPVPPTQYKSVANTSVPLTIKVHISCPETLICSVFPIPVGYAEIVPVGADTITIPVPPALPFPKLHEPPPPPPYVTAEPLIEFEVPLPPLPPTLDDALPPLELSPAPPPPALEAPDPAVLPLPETPFPNPPVAVTTEPKLDVPPVDALVPCYCFSILAATVVPKSDDKDLL